MDCAVHTQLPCIGVRMCSALSIQLQEYSRIKGRQLCKTDFLMLLQYHACLDQSSMTIFCEVHKKEELI